MKNKSLTFFAILSLLFGAFLATGCQTMEGAGEDIEDAGEEIQDAAN